MARWGLITDSRAQSLAVIKHLDVFKYFLRGFGPGLMATMVNQLGLQCMKEAYGRSVIPTIALGFMLQGEAVGVDPFWHGPTDHGAGI